MDGRLIRAGGIIFVAGKIIDVGPADLLLSRHPDAQLIDRPGSIVLPGLVNAHVHLELSALAPPPRPARFVDWIWELIPKGEIDPQAAREFVAKSIAKGVSQCLRSGVTCVGDISRNCSITRPLLKNGPLRAVSYGEVQAMAQRRGLLEGRLSGAIDQRDASSRLRIALTPHAPYSVEFEGYRRCLQVARERRLPLATHLAETPGEAPFLAHHNGPFLELWQKLHAWDEKVPTFAGGPIRFAKALGLLDYPTLLAHVNYCDQEELDILAAGQASVVYCPRTHAYFGHPAHKWRQMLERGINVAIGTDSCASSPDLNLLEDLLLLRRIAPDMPAVALWELATNRAARATQMDDLVGSVAPGKFADFVLFACEGHDPLSEILDTNRLPEEVWIEGSPIDLSE